jgi:hypothetical protein
VSDPPSPVACYLTRRVGGEKEPGRCNKSCSSVRSRMPPSRQERRKAERDAAKRAPARAGAAGAAGANQGAARAAGANDGAAGAAAALVNLNVNPRSATGPRKRRTPMCCCARSAPRW